MKDIGERDVLQPADIEALVRDVLKRAGLLPESAAAVARTVRRAEMAGLRRLGLGLVPHMVEHIRTGRTDAHGVPQLSETGPATLHVDANGGFACPALETATATLCDRALSQGVAFLSVQNAYPISTARSFLDDCTAHGTIGIASVAGLAARNAPNGKIELVVESRTFGLPGTSAGDPSALVPLIPHLAVPALGASHPFEGPLGPPFRLSHTFFAIRNDLWPLTPPAAPSDADPTQKTGIAVSPSLLEKIINA